MYRQLLALPILFGLTTAAVAQDAPQPADQTNQDRGDRGDRRNFDPAQMRQRMMDGLKEQLKPSDEEWQVLQPALEKVMTAQRNSRGGWGGGRGRGGPGGGAGAADQPETDVARTSRELRTSLQNESATPQEISDKLNAYRAAREKAETELSTARGELKDLVTQRQEAVLVITGILE